MLDDPGLIFGIVADMDEIADDEQILASGALVPFTDGSSFTVNSPLWIAGQENCRPTLPKGRSAQRRGAARRRLY